MTTHDASVVAWAETYAQRRHLLVKAADALEVRLKSLMEDVLHIDRISFRVKSMESFKGKCLDAGVLRYQNPLEEVEDQIAGRVIVFFRDDLDTVEAAVRGSFSAAVEADRKRPASDDAFGYESNHYVFVIDEHMKPSGWDEAGPMPTTFELQIRTLFMHAFAEPQHDLGYKGSGVDREAKRQFAWIAASAWGADTTMNDLYRKLANR